jgi:hypothetical protein
MKLLRTLFVASGVVLLSATALSAQAAQVTCKDGAKSKGGRGACSSHGGIAVAAKADTKVAKADVKADTKMAKADAKADTKMAKADVKADAKMDKMGAADAKVDAKVAKVTKAKARTKKAKA